MIKMAIPRKALFVTFAFFAMALFFGGIRVTHAAFGVSPPFLNADHLVPGVTYSQTIYLVQDQPDNDLPIKVTMTVPSHVQSWITLDQGLNFVIPKGTRQFPVVVSVKVPQGEGLGVYSGNMVFATVPGQSGQVTIALGANVAVNLTVGNGVFEQFSIPYVSFPSIEEGWNPRVFFRLQNGGNVPEQVDSAVLDLYDQFDSVRLAYMTKQGGFPQVAPFTNVEFAAEFPTDFHLGAGDYWGSVTFYKNYHVITSYKGAIHVLPAGSLSSPFEAFLSSLKNYWFYGVLGLVVALLIVYRVWVIISRRKKTAV
jgi:hypothetical protein